jgi:uncharacterized pyridoxamine 5'-phosphate oxidase family protein
MKRLPEQVVHFLQNQGFVVVSSLNPDYSIHNACKGIIKINPLGKIYLFDLYRKRTFTNLKRNPCISITAVDEHRFRGYCLKGKAKIVKAGLLKSQIIHAWEGKIASRITQRVLKNIRGEKGHPSHPEILLPKPEYLIVMEAEEIIDLTPQHLK